MNPLSRLASRLAGAAVVCWSLSALADDRAVATELFNAGRDLMKQGDYAAACPKLAESVRLDPTVGALARLAACEEHESQMVLARAHWEQALNLARSVHDEREPEVASALARVDRVVPKLLLTSSAPLPPEAVLRVDDLVLGPGSVGVSLPVSPGAHAITVTAPSARPWTTSIETHADGATTTVTIPLIEAALPPPVAPPPAPEPVPTVAPRPEPEAPPHGALPPLRVAALVTGAGAVVGLGLGAAFGIRALTLRADARCQGTVCPDDASASKLNDAKSSAQLSTIAFAAGGVLAASGVALWLLAPSARSKGAVALQPTVGGVLLSGRWE